MRNESPYHEGELAIQERLGEVEGGRRNGRVISDRILKGALKFLDQQALAVFGSVDDDQNVWASAVIGKPGFIKAPDDRRVDVDLTRVARNRHDPLWKNIQGESRVGVLVIDLGTRRRLRINGHLSTASKDRLRLEVEESYPNCPKYIQRRHIVARPASAAGSSVTARHGRSIEPALETLIRTADTFFVASAHPHRGVDASHRGGDPGFVRVLGNGKLRVPDFVGNHMFNTLGNFTVNPRAGLLFLDFERNRTLQMIGRPEILWDLDDPANETGGTGRFWDFEVERWLETGLPLDGEWEFLDASPHNPRPVNPGSAHNQKGTD